MVNIVATDMSGSSAKTVTETTLTASDTFVFNNNAKSVLVLRNPTAGALTVTIDGDGASTVPVPGVGSISIAAGFSTGSIGIGVVKAIPLDGISKYLAGTIAVTGGTGLVAQLLEF